MFHSIVVGTDGSPTADEAVRQATELAKLCGAKLHLVHAYRPLESYPMAAETLSAGATDFFDPAAVANEVVEEAVKAVGEQGVECVAHAVAGDPAHALIEVAESTSADLIVVGNKGMNSKARFLLGSVPNKVSHHAPCGVLIARTS